MKFVLCLFLSACFCIGCKNKTLSPKYLSSIMVARETETAAQSLPKPAAPEKSRTLPSPPAPKPAAHYHIIVSSFGVHEKIPAEKMTARLKKQNYPAHLIYSSRRYRVSIESFSTQAEALTAREKYRTLLNRQDLWIFKTE